VLSSYPLPGTCRQHREKLVVRALTEIDDTRLLCYEDVIQEVLHPALYPYSGQVDHYVIDKRGISTDVPLYPLAYAI
jgi:hypothetical protein